MTRDGHHPDGDQPEAAVLHARVNRWRLWSEITWRLFALIGVMVAFAALAIVVVRQSHIQDVVRQQQRTQQILLDCTTIGHPCYEAGVRRTNDVRRQLERDYEDISIAANYCTTRNPAITMKALVDCVVRVVRGLAAHRPPLRLPQPPPPTPSASHSPLPGHPSISAGP